MTRAFLLAGSAIVACSVTLVALSVNPGGQGASDRPASAANPLPAAAATGTPTDSWPTYNGDYSGRRFSPLSKINDDQHQLR